MSKRRVFKMRAHLLQAPGLLGLFLGLTWLADGGRAQAAESGPVVKSLINYGHGQRPNGLGVSARSLAPSMGRSLGRSRHSSARSLRRSASRARRLSLARKLAGARSLSLAGPAGLRVRRHSEPSEELTDELYYALPVESKSSGRALELPAQCPCPSPGTGQPQLSGQAQLQSSGLQVSDTSKLGEAIGASLLNHAAAAKESDSSVSKQNRVTLGIGPFEVKLDSKSEEVLKNKVASALEKGADVSLDKTGVEQQLSSKLGELASQAVQARPVRPTPSIRTDQSEQVEGALADLAPSFKLSAGLRPASDESRMLSGARTRPGERADPEGAAEPASASRASKEPAAGLSDEPKSNASQEHPALGLSARASSVQKSESEQDQQDPQDQQDQQDQQDEQDEQDKQDRQDKQDQRKESPAERKKPAGEPDGDSISTDLLGSIKEAIGTKLVQPLLTAKQDKIAELTNTFVRPFEAKKFEAKLADPIKASASLGLAGDPVKTRGSVGPARDEHPAPETVEVAPAKSRESGGLIESLLDEKKRLLDEKLEAKGELKTDLKEKLEQKLEEKFEPPPTSSTTKSPVTKKPPAKVYKSPPPTVAAYPLTLPPRVYYQSSSPLPMQPYQASVQVTGYQPPQVQISTAYPQQRPGALSRPLYADQQQVASLPAGCQHRMHELTRLLGEALQLADSIGQRLATDESISFQSHDAIAPRLAKIRAGADEARLAASLGQVRVVSEAARSAGLEIMRLAQSQLVQQIEPRLRQFSLVLRKNYALFRKAC